MVMMIVNSLVGFLQWLLAAGKCFCSKNKLSHHIQTSWWFIVFIGNFFFFLTKKSETHKSLECCLTRFDVFVIFMCVFFCFCFLLEFIHIVIIIILLFLSFNCCVRSDWMRLAEFGSSDQPVFRMLQLLLL